MLCFFEKLQKLETSTRFALVDPDSPGLRKYVFWFLCFLFCSLLGQYGCAIPVDLSFLLGEGWWIPLGVITIVPMVDVSRSYTQHYAEKANISIKNSLFLMLISSLAISVLFSIYGGLPITICIATFSAVNLGGLIDIVVFRLVKIISLKPYVRMLFSNLAATLTGGGIFYIIAYSNVLSIVARMFGIDFNNNLQMDNLLKGWILQSVFIWISGSIMATLIGKSVEFYEVKNRKYLLNNYGKIKKPYECLVKIE